MRVCRAFAVLALVGGLDGAVILDRIAVVVGKEAIKLSDIDRDLRVTEFLNREKVDFSPAARRKAAERLIDQTIIRNEVANGGYVRPSKADVDALLKQIVQDRFGGSTARMREALSQYGLTEDQLRAQLLWQLTVLRFIEQRFRTGVLVTDEDLHAYYNEHYAELRREYPKNSNFEALQSKIRDSLEGERVNQNFVQWIEQARKRNRIEYRQGALE